MDKEISELLKKFLMLSALAKDDSKAEPLPIFSQSEPIKHEVISKTQSTSQSRFPALRAKMAKMEQETTSSSSDIEGS